MTDRVTGGLMKAGALPHLPYLLHLPKPLRFHADTEGNDATHLWEKWLVSQNAPIRGVRNGFVSQNGLFSRPQKVGFVS